MPSHEITYVAAGVLIQDGGILHCQRHQNVIPEWSESWTLPGGKLEVGETSQEALIREWREEVSVELLPEEVTVLLFSFIHRIKGYSKAIHVSIYLIEPKDGRRIEPVLTHAGGQAMKFLPIRDYRKYRTLASTRPAMESYMKLIGADSSEKG